MGMSSGIASTGGGSGTTTVYQVSGPEFVIRLLRFAGDCNQPLIYQFLSVTPGQAETCPGQENVEPHPGDRRD